MENNLVIQKCEGNEIEEIRHFFGKEWNQNHVFVVSAAYVDWFFGNGNGYNVIYARDLEIGEIVGILCYIPNSHFDSRISRQDTFVWITNWLVKKEGYNGLGLRLLMALMKIEGTRQIGTVGNNQVAMEIYSALRFRTGTMVHYFMVNRKVSEFGIISGYSKAEDKVFAKSSFVLKPVFELESVLLSDSLQVYMDSMYPKKTLGYLEKKYLRDPFYEYFVFGITSQNDDLYLAFLVCRVVLRDTTKAVRIVEYFGELCHLDGLYEELQRLLCAFGAEYLDLYCGGLQEEAGLLRSGFEINTMDSNLVVPSYFEPYLHENIRIPFAYHAMRDTTLICKGDCDRDHPRIL